jgi:DNA-binding LytR/AlgR family response regulator
VTVPLRPTRGKRAASLGRGGSAWSSGCRSSQFNDSSLAAAFAATDPLSWRRCACARCTQPFLFVRTAQGAVEPDIALFDLQLGRARAFEIFEDIGVDALPPVMFMAMYEPHALKAFEAHALRFM